MVTSVNAALLLCLCVAPEKVLLLRHLARQQLLVVLFITIIIYIIKVIRLQQSAGTRLAWLEVHAHMVSVCCILQLLHETHAGGV
jgi:hypothetical protein